jgi:hypothetical protein
VLALNVYVSVCVCVCARARARVCMLQSSRKLLAIGMFSAAAKREKLMWVN